jgi:hypothetical protein
LIAPLIATQLQIRAWAQGGGQTISQDYEEGFKVAPIPIVQPVTEEGAGLAAIYRYHLHRQSQSPSSYAGVGGFITSNRSWGAGAAQVFYLDQDHVRARFAASYADVRYNFYGIGTESGEAGGNAGISVLMEQKGVGGLAEVLYRFYGQWYGGAAYRIMGEKSNFRPNPQFDASVIAPSELNLRVASLGPRILRDARR